ncbi:hypothetical protein FKN01_15905 [Streptomyces sp. 130]|nr:hypothetical protein FKN01_15905 [Streptomyces sp. 130]
MNLVASDAGRALYASLGFTANTRAMHLMGTPYHRA